MQRLRPIGHMVWFGVLAQSKVLKRSMQRNSKKTIPKEDARNWNWALFDYGALALKDKKINKKSRHYAKQSKFIGSFRQYRAKLMRFMLSQPKHDMPKTAALDFLEEILRKEEQDYSAGEILESLIQDKLVKQNNTRIFL